MNPYPFSTLNHFCARPNGGDGEPRMCKGHRGLRDSLFIKRGCGAYAVALLGLPLLHDDGRHRGARDDAQLRRGRDKERVARCSEQAQEEGAKH